MLQRVFAFPRTSWPAWIISAILAMAVAGVANAHVTVWPREANSNENELYTLRVPSEREVPTVRVRVEFPENVVVSRFVPVDGWQKEVETDSTGRIAAVTWSGGQIGPDELGLFQFSARNPTGTGEVAFKTYQTYADGSVAEWTGGAASPAPTVKVTQPSMGPADLTRATNVGNVITAIWILDNSALHELEESTAAGTIPTGSLGRVQRARTIAAATNWPAGLQENAQKLATVLGHLNEALLAENVAAAAGPASEVHDLEHDLSEGAYAWLGEMAGLGADTSHH